MFFLQSTSMAISVSTSNGQFSLSESYDLDRSTGLSEQITLGDQDISQRRFLDGTGHNSFTQSSGSPAGSATSIISSQGPISTSGTALVSENSAEHTQNVNALGTTDISVVGSTDSNLASQEAGVYGGLLSSWQTISVGQGQTRAGQATRIAGALGYSTGKAQSSGNLVEVTGGLNGLGMVTTQSVASAGDKAQAQAAVQADCLNSKAYSAGKATSSEADVYSFASSGDKLGSLILAQADNHVSTSQNLDVNENSLVYANAAGESGSQSYAEQGNTISGSIAASAGSPQIIDNALNGDGASTLLGAIPVPGSWVNYGGGLLSGSTPFALEDPTNGIDHVFVQGTDRGLYDFRGYNWYSLGGKFYGDPSAVRANDGKIHVLVQGLDNGLWDCWLNPATMTPTWKNMGGQITSSPSAAIEPTTNNVGVATRGADGGLWYLGMTHNNPDLNMWWNLGGQFAGTPNVIAHGSDKMLVFVWGPGSDNTYYANEMTISPWSGSGTWHSLGGDMRDSPVAINEPGYPSYVGVFGKGADGALWANDVYLNTWSGNWKYQGGQVVGKPALIADGTTTSDYIHAFIRGTDNSVWDCRTAAGISSPGDWYPLNGRINSNPTAIWDQDGGYINLFASAGGNNNLWQYFT
jgi:hypothetical protein